MPVHIRPVQANLKLSSMRLVRGSDGGHIVYKFGDDITKIVRNTEQVLTLVVVLALAGTGLYFVYKKQTQRMAEAPTTRTAGAAGMAWGFAAIARPNALLFLPLPSLLTLPLSLPLA